MFKLAIPSCYRLLKSSLILKMWYEKYYVRHYWGVAVIWRKIVELKKYTNNVHGFNSYFETLGGPLGSS